MQPIHYYACVMLLLDFSNIYYTYMVHTNIQQHPHDYIYTARDIYTRHRHTPHINQQSKTHVLIYGTKR